MNELSTVEGVKVINVGNGYVRIVSKTFDATVTVQEFLILAASIGKAKANLLKG